MNEAGTLRVTRDPAKWRDKRRAYRILIDGAQVGKVRRGASVSVALAAGAHRVRLRIDWCTSPELPVEIAAGRQSELECGPERSELGNARQMREAPETYLWLRPAQGPADDGRSGR